MHLCPPRRRLVTILTFLTALAVCAPSASAAPLWGPLTPPHPHLGPVGTATMHGDAASSDATPLPGPGAGPHAVDTQPLAAACPTVLQGSDSLVVTLCTTVLGRTPTLHLFDPNAPMSVLRRPLASFELKKGSLLGGVYAYMDNENRLVAVDGDRRLQRVAHFQNEQGKWGFRIDSTVDLSGAVGPDDNVTGLSPDWDGNVWFATSNGTVGVADTAGRVHSTSLGTGENVENSISTSPAGTAVATTHALYQLSLAGDTVQVDWRQGYDRGGARKPGQLSWGTGSTPTYFGPATGSDYVAIVDNADPVVSLRVFEASTGADVCTIPVLDDGRPNGSENSPIGIGNSVFVAGTYGYPYPATPDSAGPAVPPSAPFGGGITRVDIDPVGCHQVWDAPVRSAAVPHLSTADGHLYTVVRQGPESTTPLDSFAFAVIDPATGKIVDTTGLPGTTLNDTLQMSGLITTNGSYLQGTITGLLRIRPS